MGHTVIIIVNYRNEQLTISFVREEIKKISSPHTVVVVNNDGMEETDERLSRALNAPLIKDIDAVPNLSENYVISTHENLGFARANNLAAEFAHKHIHPEYLLFSNNDIRIKVNDTLELLINKLQDNPKIGIIGPKVEGQHGELQSPEPFYPFWDRYVAMYLATPFMGRQRKTERFHLDYAEKAAEGYHYKVMGSFFLMRLSDYLDCGMMDPNTFLYSEESILSERIKKIGKAVYYYPEACVVHAHGATTKQLGSHAMNQCKIASECYYYREYIHEKKWKIRVGVMLHKLILLIRG